MERQQLLTIRDYCKKNDVGQVSMGFQHANLAKFIIKSYVVLGLRENQFDGNVKKDPWEHLAQFYETS